MYREDWFGLKTQNKNNRVKTFVIPGVDHDSWTGNDKVWNLAVFPYLT